MNIALIIGVIIFLIVITIFIFLIIIYRDRLDSCENNESPFCYSLSCPGSVTIQNQCSGFAQRSDGDTFSCATQGAYIYNGTSSG